MRFHGSHGLAAGLAAAALLAIGGCGGSQPAGSSTTTTPRGVGLATPVSVAAGETTLLTVTVTPGANPASTGFAVSADLGPIGLGSAQPFHDDGINGDALAHDNVFSFSAPIPASTAAGSKSLTFTVSDAQSRSSGGAIGLTVLAAPLAIHDIQGSGPTSPYTGQSVTTRGVVTGRRYNNGFYIQTPDAVIDADPNTSEGVFVYTATAPPAAAAVGTYVEVTGTVAEYVQTAYGPSTTEIASPTVTALTEAYPLPAPVTLTATDLPPDGTLDQLERYEGMRVFVRSLRAVSPTGGSVSETSATASSNGVFYAVIDGTARPFREPGVEVGVPLPAGSPAGVPRFDGNPERLRIESYGQIGSAPLTVTTGALVSDVVGVLDYDNKTWTILPDPSSPPAVSALMDATPVPPPAANEFTVASLNLERFYDTVDDPTTSDAVLTAEAFANRLNKASLAIRTMGHYPDILGVEEVENLTTLEALAAKVNADAVAGGNADPGYAAYLEEGNDVSGIDVGFLVKTARVTVTGVVQEGKDATYTDPNSGNPALLNDRPPLVLTAEVAGPTSAFPLTVIVNHLRSLGDVDSLTDGRVRAKRLAQAEFLAGLIQARQAANPDERIVSVGDYNAYEVNDGYVDVMGVIRGTPAPSDQDVLAGPAGLVAPPLTDLVTTMPAAERYSYSFDGSSQVLDHILVNDAAMLRFAGMHYARFDADFPESDRNDPARPNRLSDHDMAVAYFAFQP